MSTELAGLQIAFLTANEGIEQIELTDPWDAVVAAGGRPQLITPNGGDAQAMHHLDKADVFGSIPVADAEPSAYAGLVLPGGVANPDQLRMHADSVRFVRAFVDAGTPIAVICHGPWTLVEAGAVRDRTITSWPSVRTDIENAGGHWVDEEVVVCDDGPATIVSSRNPDLPAFCAALVSRFAGASVST